MLCVILRILSLSLQIFFNSLSDKGIFVFEDPYIGDVIRKNSYDQIYDEHVYLFSISSIIKLAELTNLQLFNAVPQITHGGSMRYYLCKKKQISNNCKIKRIDKI